MVITFMDAIFFPIFSLPYSGKVHNLNETSKDEGSHNRSDV